MSRITLFTVAIAVLFAGSPAAALEGGDRGAAQPDPGFVIELSASGDGPRWIEAVALPGENAAGARRRLTALPGVVAVYPNHDYRLHGTPDDPRFPDQWNLLDIGWDNVWPGQTGSGATVAILDSGVGTGGEDLACHVFVDPYNAATLTEGLAAAADENGHGTHVTGTVAQCTDNGRGVAGVAPGASIMPVRVSSPSGSITSTYVARGIDWAVGHGADVINMSLGDECSAPWPSCSDPLLDMTIAAAVAAGVVVVVSSGNDAAAFVSRPANGPDAIAVGASTIDHQHASYSNQGADLDLVAPGGSGGTWIVQETFSGSVYGYVGFQGTSMAAPHVSGVAALLRGAKPEATSTEIRAALEGTALDLGTPGWDESTGTGLLQADRALQAVAPPPPPPSPVCPEGAACDSVFLVDAGGQWRLWDELDAASAVSSFFYGDPGDVAFSGDWDCDGTATPGLYRQSDGFVYLRNSNTQGIADIEFFFGNPGDLPIAGDFDGDGCDTVGIYRPGEGRFFIINELGENGGGLGAAEVEYVFGNLGDTPFIGDFDGDGVDTVGLHRASTGLVYFRNSHTQGNAHGQFVYGDPGDVIVAGDWDGDGDDTVAVYRAVDGSFYFNLTNAAGAADFAMAVGGFVAAATAGR